MIEKVKDTMRDLTPLSILLDTGFDYTRPRRGQVRCGKVARVEGKGLIVDIGAKAEGLVPTWDLDKLKEVKAEDMSPGDEVSVAVTNPGNGVEGITLSLAQARGREDWQRGEQLLESEEIVEAEVIDHNQGGLLVEFGQLRGFVPASHVDAVRSYRGERRQERLAEMKGQRLALIVLEVEQTRNRLVLSEREALRARRERRTNELLEELSVGDVMSGRISGVCHFGAFVDLGGAKGLIHISELSWSWVKHLSEVRQVGEEVETYVLKLDREKKRIGLSLKQLRPDPWIGVEDRYHVGEVVQGTVANVADFGAFVELEEGIIGLVHAAELEGPPSLTPHDLASRGDVVTLRILGIDSQRHRMSLSQVQARDRPAVGSHMAEDGFWDSLAEAMEQGGGEK